MNLRNNSLLLALLTALIAVLGDWSGSVLLAGLWRLPAGLLLLGLAYESIVTTLAGVTLNIVAPAQWFLGRASHVHLGFRQTLQRTIKIEFAPIAPPAFNMNLDIRSLSIPAGTSTHSELQATPRRLGNYHWPAMHIRIAGPLGLAWWGKK